jgi:hypothetical protein
MRIKRKMTDWTLEEIERWEAEGGAAQEKQKVTNIVPFPHRMSPDELRARAKALSDRADALRAWWDETGGFDPPVF